MAKILVVCPRVPYPLTGGAKIRIFNIAKILSKEHEVDLLIVDESPIDNTRISPLRDIFGEVTLFQFPRYRFRLNALKGIFSTRPLQTHYFTFSAVSSWLDENEGDYDLFFPITIRVTQYLRGREVPTMLDFTDSISQTYLDISDGLSFPKSLIYRIDGVRARSYERQMMDIFEHSIITTKADKENIESENSFTNLSVFPNGADPQYLTQDASPIGSEPWITFVGKMDYYPNEDAVIYFSNEIFPIIRKHNPNAEFLIVGVSPTARIQKLDRESGIRVTGFVEDPKEYLIKSRVVVAPLRYGGGIQNKVLNAMALGKSVVTTPLGATGINPEDGKHLRIADSPEQFADYTSSLFQNQISRKRIGHQARRHILENYNWDSLAPFLLDKIEGILNEE